MSKNTKIGILKGDYFFSKGFMDLSKLGNLKLIEYYTNIANSFNDGRYANPSSSLHKYIILNYVGFFYFALLYFFNKGYERVDLAKNRRYTVETGVSGFQFTVRYTAVFQT